MLVAQGQAMHEMTAIRHADLQQLLHDDWREMQRVCSVASAACVVTEIVSTEHVP
jgi:hypothetical protein